MTLKETIDELENIITIHNILYIWNDLFQEETLVKKDITESSFDDLKYIIIEFLENHPHQALRVYSYLLDDEKVELEDDFEMEDEFDEDYYR